MRIVILYVYYSYVTSLRLTTIIYNTKINLKKRVSAYPHNSDLIPTLYNINVYYSADVLVLELVPVLFPTTTAAVIGGSFSRLSVYTRVVREGDKGQNYMS